MFKKLTVTLAFFYSILINAQDYKNFESIRSSGLIPSEFYTLSSEKYKAQTDKEVKSTDKKNVAKSKKSFLLTSNFSLNELLTSGDVLFNDSLSVYISKVADEILKNDLNLRKQIHFYAVKSPYVNAFSTAQGYVLVNIGLLAQLENEAQLAFILSHEIIHYRNKHSINQKINYDTKIKKETSDVYEKMLARSAYSKELESESDIEGLELYMKTKYSKDVFEGVFNVLKYSHLPVDEIPYDYSYLESTHFKIRKDYKPEKINDIKVEEEDDTLATHPNTEQRLKDLKNALTKYNVTEKGTDFILAEKYFLAVRKIARYELSQLFMEEKNYPASLYNSYLILKEYPNDLFAKMQTLQALYFATKYTNRGDISKIITSDDDVQGEMHAVNHLLYKINSEDLNILAINYAFKLRNKLPKDAYVAQIATDLLKELIVENEKKSSDYKFLSNAQIEEELKKVTVKEEVVNVETKKSKYDKIKSKEDVDAEKLEFSTKYAFSDICTTDKFAEEFKKMEKDINNSESEKKKNAKREKLEKVKQNKIESKKGKAIGIDKLIVVNPVYFEVDERKKEAIQYLDSEDSKGNSETIIKDITDKVGLKIEYINPTEMKSNEVDKFNDLALLNRWFQENSNHDFEYVSLYQRSIDKLIEKRGTSYATWTGVINVREKKDVNVLAICYTIMVPYFIPLAVYAIAKPDYRTIYYNLTYDLKTGENKFSLVKDIKFDDKKPILKSLNYEAFSQIKNRR